MSGKNVLIALSSYNGPFYADGAKTGVFVVEALHPFNVYRAEGYNVTFVSETGSFGWDEHSLAPDFLSGQDKADLENSDSEFNKCLKNIKKASEVNPADYCIFFAAAGHATLFDFPTASGLQKLASEIYKNNGVVAAVCHGPSIFTNLRDADTGKFLVEGKSITGFTDDGERILHVDTIMKEKNLVSIEEMAPKCGAKYLGPVGPWDDYSVTDGRIVTGVNPASAASTAVRSINALP